MYLGEDCQLEDGCLPTIFMAQRGERSKHFGALYKNTNTIHEGNTLMTSFYPTNHLPKAPHPYIINLGDEVSTYGF